MLYKNNLTGRIYNRDAIYDLWVSYTDTGLTDLNFEDWMKEKTKENFTKIERDDSKSMIYEKQYELYKKAFELAVKNGDSREYFLERAREELKKGEQAE